MLEYKLPSEVSAWIEVDSDAIVHNLERIKKTIKPATKILAVVKANAYGLGQNEVAEILQRAGVYCFGVTNLSEAINLRNGGIHSPIVLFAPLLPQQIEAALEYGIIPTVSSKAQLQEVQKVASDLKKRVKIHIELETGMGRTGIWLTDISSFIEELLSCSNIEVEGIYTHLAKAGSDKEFSEKQFSAFKEGCKLFQLRGIDIQIRHIVNSAGVINYPHMHLDMVRVGTLLFGQTPIETKFRNIKDPWKARAKIINIRTVPGNWPIGYGGEYTTRRESKIGIVPIGFADGYNVSPKIRAKGFIDLLKVIVKEILSYYGKGPKARGVEFENSIYPVVGRIGMQLTMVDFTGSAIQENDTVNFSLRRINAPLHLPRVYLKDKKPYKIAYPEREISLLEKGEM
ncbi:MAG: hypothetical protein APF76_17280 [Desulfitibacter sp. BRH_c19]|nr:MAG: hypothetical protein APF76_17280 [Desulfitibacter sp. BRH_c19]